MLLAIDIGNTAITFGVFQQAELRATWRIATDVRRMKDEYGLAITTLLPMKGVSTAQITHIAMCSVVPPLTPAFEELSKDIFHVNPIIVGAGTKTGIRILYDNPRDVGADRVADAVGAYTLYGGPAIVVDFGTATVFDAISRDGDYLGGAIAPGLQLSADSLFFATSQLRRVELVRPKSAISKNTVHAMQAGLIFGYAGLVEEMVRRFKSELGEKACVVGTGGLVKLIAAETDVLEVVDQDLTLRGLYYIHELNYGVSGNGG